MLPLDYYSNMLGVLIDQKVLQQLLQSRLPKFCAQLRKYEVSLDLLAFQWLVCLYVTFLPSQTEYRVLDLFYLKGSEALLRIAITVFQLMEDEVLAADSFEEIVLILGSFGTDKKIGVQQLLKRFTGPISPHKINGLRKELRVGIVNDLKEQVKANQKPHKAALERINFINRFFLYHGLAKYYQQHPEPTE